MAKATRPQTVPPIPEAPTNPLTPAQEDARYLDHMRRAALSLESASVHLRLFQLLFTEDQSQLRATVPDTAAAAGAIKALLISASDDLFKNFGTEAGAHVGNAVLSRLWAVLSIVILCEEATLAGRFGDGGNIVTFPVVHAMEGAMDRLQALRRQLDKYLANVPTPSKVRVAS